MASRTLISVEEYLRTSYRPDCDYVDGEVLERNVGETDHSWLQTALSAYLFARRKEWGITVLVEQRVQVTSTGFRVPDICVIQGPKPTQQILTEPPFICIEVLSPEDRMSRTEERVDDYLAMGVRYVWVLGPATKLARSITPVEGWREEKSAVLKTLDPPIEIPLAEIFS
ncbi:MAG TPA: Uma2 family endonuclease [Bryobacteraceae bacterium]|nr:Uma2 family endonuclease [Bryobacteraceae bacterium]